MKPALDSSCAAPFVARTHTQRCSQWYVLCFALGLMTLPNSQTVVAHPNKPGRPQLSPIVLENATLHTITGEVIENGQLLFAEGRIAAIGRTVEAPTGVQAIDLGGKNVYPGFIDANSILGLTEIGAVGVTQDMGEAGDVNPNVKADTAINPDSELIPVARSNGVLTVHICPRPRGNGILAGTSVVANLDGWTIEEMTVASPAAMHVVWPQVPTPRRGRPSSSRSSSGEREEAYRARIRILTDALADARSYFKAKRNGDDGPHEDLRWEALRPVIEGETPIVVEADRAAQIRDAVHWAKREGVRVVIMGGRDAWRLTDLLKASEVPVIISGVNALPLRRWEPYDTAFQNPNKLHQAGILFAIANEQGGSNARNLPYEAAQAAAHGLPREEAVKALTIYPAKILGVDDRIGSLEVGKDATFFVTDGDPLDIRSQVLQAYIRGRAVDLSNRQTRLYEKYLEKYEQLDSL